MLCALLICVIDAKRIVKHAEGLIITYFRA